jgi:hypothetical protein
MPSKRIIDLPFATVPLTGTELTLVFQDGTTKSVALDEIALAPLPDTGVTPGEYGTGDMIPRINVDEKGRIVSLDVVPVLPSTVGEVPVLKFDDFVMSESDRIVINDKPGTCIVTMLDPALHVGRQVTFINGAPQALNSSEDNIIQQNGSGPTNAILANPVGRWADLISTGLFWRIIRSG